MKPFFLSIQGSYQHVELALFSQTHCLKTIFKNDNKASSFLISYLAELLHDFNLTVHDLAFIALDKGPGAFTSLRVSIATINGISFVQKIPLIGINGLEARYEESLQKLPKITHRKIDTIACLLNAYNQDLYFYIKNIESQAVFTGCKNNDLVLEYLAQHHAHQNILFTGNGTKLYQDHIQNKFGAHAIIEDPLQEVASAYQIGMMGYQAWQQETQATNKIIPYYLKTQEFAIKKN